MCVCVCVVVVVVVVCLFLLGVGRVYLFYFFLMPNVRMLKWSFEAISGQKLFLKTNSFQTISTSLSMKKTETKTCIDDIDGQKDP